MNKGAAYSTVIGIAICALGYLYANYHYKHNDDLGGSALIIVFSVIIGGLITICGIVLSVSKTQNNKRQ